MVVSAGGDVVAEVAQRRLEPDAATLIGKGKIVEVKKGATTAHVRLEIGPGQIITSSITNEAVDELGLKAGITAFAVIKASEVMIAVE